MSRFILITASAEYERTIRASIAPLSGSLQSFQASYLPESPEAIIHQQVGEQPEVLILGPELPRDEALKFAAVMDLQYPEISIVLVAEDDGELALNAMRSGVRDLIRPSADMEQIRALVERASLAAAGRRRGLAPNTAERPTTEGGRVIAVMSPKGGVGKTTVASNLAIGLGQIAPMSVVLVDLDLQFGDIASGLMIDPDFTITDSVVGAASQDAMVLKTYLSLHPGNIYVLCAPRNPIDMDGINGEHIVHLLHQLRTEFQYVVIDTAPGLGEHVLATLEGATDAVWVCGMDVPSIRGMRTGFQILSELNLLPDGRHVVLNMADRRTGLTVQDVEATIGAPVDVVLPRSRAVPFSTNKGVPLLQDGSRDAAAKGLRHLVERFKPNWEGPRKKLHRRAVVQ
ncbi:CpaE family protein [Pseudarthrobacter sp. NPDC058329]|uniref:AAA family ATPase n=1 Tax=Pseudarthrobacter sp. NPDC058329 TaxID=3346448 RepID=UPI0036DD18C0